MRMSPRWLGRRGWGVGLLVAAVAASAAADVVYLKTGGQVEGRLAGAEDGYYRIRTTVGVVRLPVTVVERVEAGPTVFDEYDRRLAQARETADAQAELGQWCEGAGLKSEARQHFEKALELNPNHAAARRALGFTRVGHLWVESRRPAPRPADRAEGARDRPADEPQRLAAALQGQWERRLRAIRSGLLESSSERSFQEGRARVLEIRDPLAVLPLTRVLSGGNVACRLLLVEALTSFEDDEATLNLAVLALTDPAESVRVQAVRELVRRQDPRIVPHYREAVRSGNEAVIRRAAYALGRLGAREAIPDLVQALTARRDRWVEVPAETFTRRVPEPFARPAVTYLDRQTRVTWWPQVGIGAFGGTIENKWERRDVVVYRTEVLEALRQITGQQYGFDAAEWLRWYEEQKP